jgi:hypothetical protein
MRSENVRVEISDKRNRVELRKRTYRLTIQSSQRVRFGKLVEGVFMLPITGVYEVAIRVKR